MRETILFAVDGCLSETKDLRSSPPRFDVIAMYRAMYEQDFRAVLLSAQTREQTSAWLTREHVRCGMLLAREESAVLDPIAWKLDQISHLVASGWKLSFYVDSALDDGQGELLARVRALGVPTLGVGYPAMTDSSMFVREQRPLRSWDDLLESVEQRGE